MNMVKNAVGREVPLEVGGFGTFAPFDGAFIHTPRIKKDRGNRKLPKLGKIVETLKAAIIQSGLQDRMTISFHHSFRTATTCSIW